MTTIGPIKTSYQPASKSATTIKAPVNQSEERNPSVERMDSVSIETWASSLPKFVEMQQQSSLLASQPTEDLPMFVEMKVDRIARKIARGKKVSPTEMAYILKHNQTKAEQASRANEQRQLTEMQLKVSRNKEHSKAILLNATIGAAGSKEVDYANLSMEGISELKAKYLTETKTLKQDLKEKEEVKSQEHKIQEKGSEKKLTEKEKEEEQKKRKESRY